MKFNRRMCVRCGGSKTITDNWKSHTVRRECPNCNGEGIEYIISPKQSREYELLKGFVNYHKPIGTSLEDWLEIKRQEDLGEDWYKLDE